MTDQSIFETVLASTVHDMKNSLSLLMSHLDDISMRLDQQDENQDDISSLRYESSRINISLMQLLTLYKLEKRQISVQIEEVILADLMEDSIAAHSMLAQNKGIQLDYECDDELIWFLDPNLIGIVLNNIIGNSIRYTNSRVLLSARTQDQQLVIQIDDDGVGYPAHMLNEGAGFSNPVDLHSGSTGLGLFFAAIIAQNHKRLQRQGKIQLQNKLRLNGGSFQIYLP